MFVYAGVRDTLITYREVEPRGHCPDLPFEDADHHFRILLRKPMVMEDRQNANGVFAAVVLIVLVHFGSDYHPRDQRVAHPHD